MGLPGVEFTLQLADALGWGVGGGIGLIVGLIVGAVGLKTVLSKKHGEAMAQAKGEKSQPKIVCSVRLP